MRTSRTPFRLQRFLELLPERIARLRCKSTQGRVDMPGRFCLSVSSSRGTKTQRCSNFDPSICFFRLRSSKLCAWRSFKAAQDIPTCSLLRHDADISSLHGSKHLLRQFYPTRCNILGILSDNLWQMAVVTAYEQQAGAIGGCRTTDTVEDVALLFFKKALASDTHDDTPFRVFNALLALSSFGNIIVMTYTAARMKQEIAKQGFLPYPQFFGRNTDLSIGRLTEYLRSKAGMSLRFITPENHRDPTPVGALVLHLASCIVLIFATVGMTTSHEAYSLLTGLAAYLVTAFFGSFLALGILLLQIFGPPGQSSPSSPGEKKKTWSQMTAGTVNPYLSACCATIYLLLNLFPVIASWFNTLNSNTDVRPSWLIPGISGMVLALSAAWWIGFLGVAKYRLRRQQKEFRYEARPEFEMADGTDSEGPGEVGVPGKERMGDGGMILAHETVLIAWVGGEMEMLSTVAASRGQGVEMDGFGLKSPYPVSRTHEMHPRLRGYG